MSMFVDKILEEKGKQIKADSIKEINLVAEAATKRFEAQIDLLKEQAKIVLPVNLLDIVSSGGNMFSIIHDVPSDQSTVKLLIAEWDILRLRTDQMWSDNTLAKGKYRVTLIIENLGPQKSWKLHT